MKTAGDDRRRWCRACAVLPVQRPADPTRTSDAGIYAEEEDVVAEEQKVEARLPRLTSASNSAFCYFAVETLKQANSLDALSLSPTNSRRQNKTKILNTNSVELLQRVGFCLYSPM